MPRRALRILANDWGAWIPLVAVMSLTTALVGVCANQFAWTHSPEFLAATRAAGLRAEEFHVVSVSVYCCVALVAAFSLTVVGSATWCAAPRTSAAGGCWGPRPRRWGPPRSP